MLQGNVMACHPLLLHFLRYQGEEDLLKSIINDL